MERSVTAVAVFHGCRKLFMIARMFTKKKTSQILISIRRKFYALIFMVALFVIANKMLIEEFICCNYDIQFKSRSIRRAILCLWWFFFLVSYSSEKLKIAINQTDIKKKYRPTHRAISPAKRFRSILWWKYKCIYNKFPLAKSTCSELR